MSVKKKIWTWVYVGEFNWSLLYDDELIHDFVKLLYKVNYEI